MATRLPLGSEINSRVAGPCSGCGQHVPLFAGYVLPGVTAPRLRCVPCSTASRPALAPVRRLRASELGGHRCWLPVHVLSVGTDGRRIQVCEACEDGWREHFGERSGAASAANAERFRGAAE